MSEQFYVRWYVYGSAVASLAHHALGHWDDAVKQGQDALSVAQEFSDDSLISLATCVISQAYAHKGDLGRAIEYAQLAVEKAPTPADKLWTQGVLAWVWCRAGETGKGIEILPELVQIVRASKFVPVEISGLSILAEGYFLKGNYDQARHTIEELLELTGRYGARYYYGTAQRLLGEIALKTNPDEAPPHFEKAISIFQDIKAENELALAFSGMGRFHKQQGNTEKAREYLTKALEIFERLGTLIEPDKVREELDELPAAEVE
jgi:tetratricopeptide (TPR) repeat protein